MADSSSGPASFWTQANALLRKNLTFQKRNIRTNIRLVSFPILLCVLLVVIQKLVNSELDKAENKCGCISVTNENGQTEKRCGIQYSTLDQVGTCPIPSPPEWPALLQVPAPEYRAVRADFIQFTDLPDDSCRRTGSCPATILFTGNNRSLGLTLAGNMFLSSSSLNSSNILGNLSNFVLGSESMPETTNFLDPAFFSDLPIYHVEPQCAPNSTFSVSFSLASTNVQQEVQCVQGLHLWRNSSSEINDELFKGYHKGNSEGKINEIVAAYDFLNSNGNNFNVSIWYNSTYKNDAGASSIALVRVPRSVNLASNAYLQLVQGDGVKMVLDFIKEMPKPETQVRLDLSSLLGTLFFTWVILQLFPVVLTSLVYEKQQNLRIMMKMHGLGDGPYWMISYAYFLVISSIYMLCFVIFGSVIDGWIIVMELYPGFSLYRGLYEFAQYSFTGNYMGTDGMRWGDLSDSTNGMRDILIIMFVEWLIVLFVAYYIDQVLSSGNGVKRSPLFFLQNFRKKKPMSSFRKPSLKRQGSKVFVKMEKADVSQEREKVEQLLLESGANHAIICDNLRKVYPGRDGNPEKIAVKGLSLALSHGECFGMLGPNGAGKTSFISMMIGLTVPTSGTAFVEGLDIRTDMDGIYTSMGVCPQHDLLWETLTGREHLLFYGRLKNLKGAALTQAVEESLKSVNLFHGGVGNKQAGKYSGGMKRRLSVAISLIGDPKVVYMDEPSTGLDPASRNNLWNVVKRAKQGRAIILTTHSMEEAEVLCDRLGIFVDGSLQCIGNPKELKARYGGSYVFTMTTSSNHEEEVESLVRHLSPNTNKIYQISGTQKFELPKQEVRIADVFQAVENAKSRFTVQAWGLADTTLEDVFIKVARGAQAFDVLP
ncbi:ABC transporter A family member 7-like isoform X2 [Vitis riparia]|uniref:ABC transporter A family member 7-like isoform X2 n=1 Tax=Vitis riparia TaxID=96939 RepID=UPI00155ACA75|nr:ABC transporter A family member 7-like isoform X2 [Vitis riparia]